MRYLSGVKKIITKKLSLIRNYFTFVIIIRYKKTYQEISLDQVDEYSEVADILNIKLKKLGSLIRCYEFNSIEAVFLKFFYIEK